MFAIAYKDEHGNGFSDTEPWIINGLDMPVRKVNELICSGCKNVILFNYKEPLPENVTWDFAREHEVLW